MAVAALGLHLEGAILARAQARHEAPTALAEAKRLDAEIDRVADQEKFDALALARRALEIREQTLGRMHTDVAHSLDTLASLLRDTRDLAAAEALFRRSVPILEQARGPRHVDVAVALNNLAQLLSLGGDYAGAESLYRRALAIKEKALGPDDPSTARGLNNLAQLLWQKGNSTVPVGSIFCLLFQSLRPIPCVVEQVLIGFNRLPTKSV